MPEIMVDPGRCMACRSCEIACGINRDSVSKTVAGAFKEEVIPTPRVSVQGTDSVALPVQCRHCEEAPCLDTCPSGALYRSQDDNRVLFDDNRC
ncbi:MAG: 4Fe-4S dicluster domain-containing protein, partial [Chloroflexota bacterium]